MQRTLVSQSLHLVGQTITLAGWVQGSRDHGGLVFIDLRDHSGVLQLAIHPENSDAFNNASNAKTESVITVTGELIERSVELINPNLETGHLELKVTSLEIISQSKPIPFQITHQKDSINEELRLKYRFLDLRREKLQRMLTRRSSFTKVMRDYMHDKGFTEVFTPILTSSSPEGARDFLVPSRLHPGKFYALPQAPQQFKQLLMVGGLPKYYQIAPCFRDEDPRADRHPGEFYQLDLEMAFATEPEEIFAEIEPLIVNLVTNFAGKELNGPVRRLTFEEAEEFYGTDKPDLRYDLRLIDLSAGLSSTEFTVFKSVLKDGGVVKCLRLPQTSLSRSQIDNLTEFVRKEGAGGLAYIIYDQEGPKSPIWKFLTESEQNFITTTSGAETGDIIFFGAGPKSKTNKILGKLRVKLAEDLNLADPNKVSLLWVTDFPMYEWDEKLGKLDFSHNPFSAPYGGLEALQNQDPLTIKAKQYDMVANGYEICSGSIRNSNPEALYKAFELVGTTRETVDERFSNMINAFNYGAPPHGGCAFGLDRFFMVLENEPNIREVIAFPKNGSAEDVLMNAPSNVLPNQLKELHISLNLPKKIVS